MAETKKVRVDMVALQSLKTRAGQWVRRLVSFSVESEEEVAALESAGKADRVKPVGKGQAVTKGDS